MNKNEIIEKYSPRQLDNFHILVWLFKDAFWLMELKVPGTLMIFPAVGISIVLTIKAFSSKDGFIPNVSVLLWLLANTSWMLQDFYNWTLSPVAVTFFTTGLVLMIYFYVWQCDILGVKKKTS